MAGNMQEYKCPCCGGALEFNPGVQKVKCPYCDTEFEMSTLSSLDEQLQNEGESNMQWTDVPNSEWQEGETEGMRVYVCKSCGGEIVGDANMGATNCPYCDNPIVMMGQFTGSLKPDYVIPFKLDKEAAKNSLKEHYKGKKLLPDSFTKGNRIEEIKAVYVPFWLFDAKANASIRYKATKKREWEDDDFRYTETEYYSVFRSGSIEFSKVPVDASSKLDNTLSESLEPYDFSEAVNFQTAYLAGYLADKYDEDQEKTISRANERITVSTENAFLTTVVGYDTVNTEKSSVMFTDGSAKYALYPMYLLSTKWQGEIYTFAMNGQTGKFVGNLPSDKGKITKMFFKTFLIVTPIAGAILALIKFIAG